MTHHYYNFKNLLPRNPLIKVVSKYKISKLRFTYIPFPTAYNQFIDRYKKRGHFKANDGYYENCGGWPIDPSPGNTAIHIYKAELPTVRLCFMRRHRDASSLLFIKHLAMFVKN